MSRRLRRAARAAQAQAQEAALRRELGLAPTEQLELVAAHADHALSRVAVTQAPCASCGRWNYHLVSCPRSAH